MKLFPVYCQANGLFPPIEEHRFHPIRKWRFDYAWPDWKVAVEVEGGIWSGGRHTRGAGFIKDMEKYSVAAVLGWCVIRTTPKDLCSNSTIMLIKTALSLRVRCAEHADAICHKHINNIAALNA